MVKIVVFVIIIALIAVIIYLFNEAFITKVSSGSERPERDNLEVLVKQLKRKIRIAHDEAVLGKKEALEDLEAYESELKHAEELLSKI